MKRPILLALILLTVSGCAPDLQALADNHNSDCLTETSVWLSFSLERNGGCHYPPPGFALVPVVPATVGQAGK